jgi:hypothetical protein
MCALDTSPQALNVLSKRPEMLKKCSRWVLCPPLPTWHRGHQWTAACAQEKIRASNMDVAIDGCLSLYQIIV